VDHWVSKDPVGLKEAGVAWAAPFAKDASGDQAVLYQMPWTNPRPEVPLSRIDLSYAPQSGSQYGTPVLFGITAASRLKK
jgi:hypothetical protein